MKTRLLLNAWLIGCTGTRPATSIAGTLQNETSYESSTADAPATEAAMLDSLIPGSAIVDAYPGFTEVARTDARVDLRGEVAGVATTIVLTRGQVDGWKDKVTRTDASFAGGSGAPAESGPGRWVTGLLGAPAKSSNDGAMWKGTAHKSQMSREGSGYWLQMHSRDYTMSAARAGLRPPPRPTPVAPLVAASPVDSVFGFVIGGSLADAGGVAKGHGFGKIGGKGTILGVPGTLNLYADGDTLSGVTGVFTTDGNADKGFTGSPLLASLTGSLGAPTVEGGLATWSRSDLAVVLQRQKFFRRDRDVATVEYHLEAKRPGATLVPAGAEGAPQPSGEGGK